MRNAKFNKVLLEIITALLVLLFTYAGSSKLIEHEVLSVQLGNVSIIKNYSDTFSWILPIVELLSVIPLIVKGFRMLGLVACLIMLGVFTAYLIIKLLTNSDLPCHCGGVISSLSWRQHVYFNLFFMAIAALGIHLLKRLNRISEMNLV